MPFCPNCKVTLAPGTTVCPLCREGAVESAVNDGPAAKTTKSPDNQHPTVSFAIASPGPDGEIISPREKRKIYVELLSVSFAIMTAVTIIVDFVFFTGLSWSRFTSLIFALLWFCLVIPLSNWGHPLRICLILGPALILGLFLWALMSDGLAWFLLPGLTIALSVEAILVTTYIIIIRLKRRGLNVVGIILGMVGLLCACIDSSVAIYLQHHLVLSWSIIVLMAVLPVAVFFFYLHYRIMNQASLRKLFRL